MSKTDVSCFGGCDGTATAEGIGLHRSPIYGMIPWRKQRPTAVDLCAGDYTVTVTDAIGVLKQQPLRLKNRKKLQQWLPPLQLLLVSDE